MTVEETMREYTSTRMKMYIDKARTGKWKDGEEGKLYDNIMELISMHDYCCRYHHRKICLPCHNHR